LEADASRGGLGPLSLAPGAAVTTGELVGDEKADVVAGAFVGAARVAEANDDEGP